MPRRGPTTVAILGADTLAEDILTKLLRDELAVEVTWRQQLDRLVRQIEAALGRAVGFVLPPTEAEAV